MKSTIKFAITLGIIGAVIGLALAVVWRITSPVIALQDQKALEEGLKAIFPGDYKFEKLNEPLKTTDPSGVIGDCFAVKSSNETEGLVVTITVPGSQAPIKLIVGVKKDGTISGVKILFLQETAGLGANADNPNYYVNKNDRITFTGQFSGKNIEKDPLEVKKDVIAITGATITSKAVTSAVKIAGNVAYNYLKGGQ